MAVASFPSVNVTGPVHVYTIPSPGSRFGNTPFYVGTCEVTPQVVGRIYKGDVKNTIAGPVLPFQRTVQGEAHTISLLLTRFSQSTYQLMRDTGPATLIAAPGIVSRWDRGSLIFGVKNLAFWLCFDNFNAPAGTPDGSITPGNDPTLPGGVPGRWYPQVEVLEHNIVAAGTMEEKLLLTLDATPQWQPYGVTPATGWGGGGASANPAAGAGGWVLYSENILDFPATVLGAGNAQ